MVAFRCYRIFATAKSPSALQGAWPAASGHRSAGAQRAVRIPCFTPILQRGKCMARSDAIEASQSLATLMACRPGFSPGPKFVCNLPPLNLGTCLRRCDRRK